MTRGRQPHRDDAAATAALPPSAAAFAPCSDFIDLHLLEYRAAARIGGRQALQVAR